MRFKIEDPKVVTSSMNLSIKLAKDKEGKSINNLLYNRIIGSLLYLTTSSSNIILKPCL